MKKVDELTRFLMTVNDPQIAKDRCWRKPKLDELSDQDFALLPTHVAEDLCAIDDGDGATDAELARLRYINELRRRAQR